MGKRAEHDMKGVTSMVFLRSRGSSNVRAAMTAGTEQPNPKISGKNARPDRPMRPMMPSIT